MTHHDITEALDAFLQDRISARLDHLDLTQEVEDAMDQYDWQSAVEGVTDDLGLASSDSVEELEEIVSRIRERLVGLEGLQELQTARQPIPSFSTFY